MSAADAYVVAAWIVLAVLYIVLLATGRDDDGGE